MSDVEDTIKYFEECTDNRRMSINDSLKGNSYLLIKNKKIEVGIRSINSCYNYPETKVVFEVGVLSTSNSIFSSFPPFVYFVLGNKNKTKVPCFVNNVNVSFSDLMSIDFHIVIEDGQFVKPNVLKKKKKVVSRYELLDI